jgi:hypothetical protein
MTVGTGVGPRVNVGETACVRGGSPTVGARVPIGITVGAVYDVGTYIDVGSTASTRVPSGTTVVVVRVDVRSPSDVRCPNIAQVAIR